MLYSFPVVLFRRAFAVLNSNLINIDTATYFEKTLELDDGNRINWKDYKIYPPLLNAPLIRSFVLRTSRQVGKSTFLGLFMAKHAHVPMMRQQYLVPSQRQCESFSKLKFGKLLTFNKQLKHMLLDSKSPIAAAAGIKSVNILNDVYIKVFVTGASIKFGYASDMAGVERVRGDSGDVQLKDEAQDMDLEAIDPILLPMLKQSHYGVEGITGTPLDPDDNLCTRFDTTTQHTMVVRCPACNRYSPLVSIKQIKKDGVGCIFCDRLIDIRTGVMVPMNSSSTKLGMHFNQLMMPGVVYHPVKYQELYEKTRNPKLDISKFYNEELGIPRVTSTSLISTADVTACGTDAIRYTPGEFEAVLKTIRLIPGEVLVYGIDWGGGADDTKAIDNPGKSHTCEMLVAFRIDNDRVKSRILYHYLWPLPDAKMAIDTVVEHARLLPPHTLICPDFMGGSYGNSYLFRLFNRQNNQGRKMLPVRLAGSMLATLDFKQDEFRVDVDRSFAISKAMAKLRNREMQFCNRAGVIKEIAESFTSMKSIITRSDGGRAVWSLKANRTNDIAMTWLIAWVGFCSYKGVTFDILY